MKAEEAKKIADIEYSKKRTEVQKDIPDLLNLLQLKIKQCAEKGEYYYNALDDILAFIDKHKYDYTKNEILVNELHNKLHSLGFKFETYTNKNWGCTKGRILWT